MEYLNNMNLKEIVKNILNNGEEEEKTEDVLEISVADNVGIQEVIGPSD